jgi:hypothetical protein
MQTVERLYYHYTTDALEDEICYVLLSKTEFDFVIDGINGDWSIHLFHPYINQAEGLIYRINISDPIPEFVIWQEDIPAGLVSALRLLGQAKMKQVITNVVRTIYESVDPKYYHKNGIHGKVKWRFDN